MLCDNFSQGSSGILRNVPSARAGILTLIVFGSFGRAQDNSGEFFEMRVRPVLASDAIPVIPLGMPWEVSRSTRARR